MAQAQINVPLLSWLRGSSRIGGSYNIYSGSVGTDPHKGAIGQRIFNYRIWPEKLEDESEVIKAAVYHGMLCYEAQNEDDIETNIFEFSNEGLKAVEAYLAEKLSEYMV